MMNWTWVVRVPILLGEGVQVSASTRNYYVADGMRLIQRNILHVYLKHELLAVLLSIIGEIHISLFNHTISNRRHKSGHNRTH